MHIHFVCRGNLYRGRLAEAYLHSKQLPGVTVTSSGTEADAYKHIIGPISWEALRILKNTHLLAFMKLLPEKTSEQVLAQADIVIVFGKDNYEVLQESFPHVNVNYRIWDIPDIALSNSHPSIINDSKRMELSESTFMRIKQNVDELIEKMPK